MLDRLIIKGGRTLHGEVHVSGAKNSALPILMATLLSSDSCTITNVPNLDDISVTVRLFRSFGAECDYVGDRVTVKAASIVNAEAPYSLVKALRASFWVLGPLVARCGSARVALPGGDAIGTRPVDLHLKGLSQMGAEIRLKNGVVYAEAPGGLYPAHINLDFPSVGATHQLMMTASLIAGQTIIDGAAREPEVIELASFLSEIGATIEGAGTSRIVVNGARELGAGSYQIEGDRIEAATYLIAGAATGGTVSVRGIVPEKLSGVMEVLTDCGCTFDFSPRNGKSDDLITITPGKEFRSMSFSTAPFPGVATDVQPVLMAAATKGTGESTITETVFENRFGHVAEYRRLGADITIDGRTARIRGVSRLSGAPVEVHDIRAGAGLVIMGLMAEGVTELSEIQHLDRGYEKFVEKLTQLGAIAHRVPAWEEEELVLGC